MKTAVVILNWNGEKLFRQFFPTLDRYTINTDIYVIDNNSNDNSIKYVESNFPRFNLILLDKNYGFAEGYNRGLSQINADLYCLLNSDVEVTENWIKPVVDIFINNKNISIAQPIILDLNKKNFFEYAGAAGGFIDSLGYPYCRGRIFDHIEKNIGQYNNNEKIFWASGACFFIRKDVWDKLGGFDNDFFAHFEEIDLCWRAFNQNYKAISVGNSKIFHLGGGTLPNSSLKWFLNYRNSLILLTKNLPTNRLLNVLFIRLIMDIISSVQFIFKGNFSTFKSIIRANISFYSRFKYYFKKRYFFNTNNKYWSIKSIVWNYYIKNQKTFKDNSQ